MQKGLSFFLFIGFTGGQDQDILPFSTDLDNFIDKCEARTDQQSCGQNIEHSRELSTGIHNGLDFSLSNDFV